ARLSLPVANDYQIHLRGHRHMGIEFGPRGLAMGLAGVGIASTTALTGAAAQTLGTDAAGTTGGIETVNVTGQRSSLDLMTAKIQDTPQSINVIPLEVMQQQGVSTLQDALKNVPGITLNAGEGGTHGDLVNLRGFSAGDDYFMDGLRDTGLYDRDSFDYESVEVYKGPASTLFGRGSTGGVINQVLKTPELYPIQNFTITGGTNDEARGTADINYVLGDSSALRVNLMGQISDVNGRPYVHDERWGIAPAIAFGIGTDTTLSLKYLHQDEDNVPDYGIPFLFGKPAPVARDTFYGLPSDDRFATHVDVLTGRVDHKINNWLSVSDTARYGRYWFDSRQTAPTYGNANCYTTAPYAGAPVCAGAATDVPVTADNPLYPVIGTPVDQIYVLRDRPSSEGTIRTAMNNLDVKAVFSTGFLKHTVVAGAEYDRETAALTRFVNQDDQIAPTPLLDPDPQEAFPGHQTTVRQKPHTETQTLGAYIIDTIDIGDQWSVIGGVRYDNFRAKFDQNFGATTQHFKHTDNIASPRGALVYKPDENVSLYFSYGTSYNPSAENLSLAASNQGLSPEKDRTYEVGGKAMVLDGLLGLTAAAFDTEMTNARISDPLNPGLQTLAGTEKVKGFELGAQGHITDNWEVVAGYTYLDAHAIGLAGPGVKGPIPNTAKNQANLWTTYDFDSGWQIGAGVNYIGERDAGTDNATVPGSIIVAHAPGYTTFDAMVGYQVNDHLSLRLNGYNLADKYYYAYSYFTRPGENHLVPGPGRTFLLTAALGL
ncbi:MAG TPA: TonB-dependent siderophore receptor, partial [Rhizomicrobium sp.]|nr:TonB-dependent siderophore receptor [Rhizomicrobium sp.]